MNCMYCGRPTNNEYQICDECLAAQQNYYAAQPVQQPVAQKKSVNLLAMLGGALALILVLGVLIGVVSASGGLFMSPAKQLAKVTEKSLSIEAISYLYAVALDSSAQQNTGREMDISLGLSDELVEMAESAAASSGAEIDLNWLKSIQLGVDMSENQGVIDAGVTLGVNYTDVLSADAILDTTKSMAYAGLPGISDTYMAVNLADMGADLKEMTDAQEKLNKILEKLPEEKDLEAMLQKFVSLAMSQIEEVERTKEVITVGDVAQKLTVLETELHAKDIAKMAIAVLEEAQKNETFYAFVDAYCQLYNESLSEYGETLSADDIIAQIPDAIKTLQTEEPSDYSIVLRTYLTNKGNVCGRSVSEKESGTTGSYVIVSKGTNWALRAEAGPSVKIDGAGTVTKNGIEGKATVQSEGKTLLALELKPGSKENGSLGTLRLTPGADLVEQMIGGTGLVEDVTDLALEINLKEKGFDIGMIVDQKAFITLGISIQEKTAETSSIPTKTIDPQDQEALMQWVGTLKLDGIVDKLKTAGVPETYVTALRALTAQLGGAEAG